MYFKTRSYAQAIENVLSIGVNFPVTRPHEVYDCVCTSPYSQSDISWGKYTKAQCLGLNGTLIGSDCDDPAPAPNVYLMSVILFFGTFITSVILKDFKNALFFPSKVRTKARVWSRTATKIYFRSLFQVRQLISDFAVIIAILSMSLLDYTADIQTPKLDVPREFKPTLDSRGWLINPFINHFWWWFVAFFPALLGVILIFMDQQITAVIVNRKENKLKKGCGYHLDLFVLAILIQICTTFGLPWWEHRTQLICVCWACF